MLKLYLQNIKINNFVIDEVIRLFHFYIDKSILFPLYLYYTSYEIAFGCILLIKEKQKYNFINIDDIIKLSKLQIDVNNIAQCEKYIFKIVDALSIKSLDNISQQTLNINSEEENLCFDFISSINQNP